MNMPGTCYARRGSPSSPAGPPLYQRLLGKDHARLPPVLQRLHHADGALVSGDLQVRWSSRRWLRALLYLAPLRMPRPAQRVSCTVTITPVSATAQHWRRVIGDATVQSRMEPMRTAGRVLERVGPMTLALDTRVDRAGRLRQICRRVRLFGIPMPALYVAAIERAIDTKRYACDIRMGSRRWGEILRYRGVLTVHDERMPDRATSQR
jgi:hypothetical protein